jgi:hypothetical protein
VASVLMIILFTLFLWLLHIFLIIAVYIFFLRRLLTISVPSSWRTSFLWLLLNLGRATSLLLDDFLMRGFLSRCWLWLILFILTFEVLFVIWLGSTWVCWHSCLHLLWSCLLLFWLGSLSDGLSVELLLLLDLVVDLSLEKLCIYSLKNSDWHSQRQYIIIDSLLEDIF